MSEYKLQHPRAIPKSSQAIGDDGEDAVAFVHELPRFLERWHLTRRFARQQGGKWTEPQGPDFSGWRRSDSLHVEIEVKIADGRLAFKRFQESQVKTLRACAADGGIALVLVLLGPHPGRYRWCPVPWASIEASYDAWAAWIEAGGDEQSTKTVDRARASLAEIEIAKWAAPSAHRYLEAWER